MLAKCFTFCYRYSKESHDKSKRNKNEISSQIKHQAQSRSKNPRIKTFIFVLPGFKDESKLFNKVSFHSSY